MKITPTAIPDVLLIEPNILYDDRGYFFEGFRLDRLQSATGSTLKLVQENHSRSKRGTLRGLHYQIGNAAQGKLVRVVNGEIWDVAVDIRRSSPTFGRHIAAHLSAKNCHALYIPPGFAHGFLTLSKSADVVYHVTDYYSREHDRSILWSDTDLNIPWPKLDVEYLLSAKDRQATPLKGAELFS